MTTRERSILQLVAEGRTNRGAAEFLSLSPKTVEKHRATLMRKLGLRNAAELTMVAIELGLVERPDSLTRLNPDSFSGGEPPSYRTRRLLGRDQGSFDVVSGPTPLEADILPAYSPRLEANDS